MKRFHRFLELRDASFDVQIKEWSNGPTTLWTRRVNDVWVNRDVRDVPSLDRAIGIAEEIVGRPLHTMTTTVRDEKWGDDEGLVMQVIFRDHPHPAPGYTWSVYTATLKNPVGILGLRYVNMAGEASSWEGAIERGRKAVNHVRDMTTRL